MFVLLNKADFFEWLIAVFALVLLLKRDDNKVITSSILSVVILVVLSGLTQYSGWLRNVAVENPYFKQLWWLLWYFGFFVSNLIGLVSIKKYHQHYQLDHEPIAKIIATGYFILGLIQLLALIERLTFDSDVAKTVYDILIVVVTYFVGLTVLFIAARGYFEYKNKRGITP